MTDGFSPLHLLLASLPSLLGVIIGGVLGFLGSWLAWRRQQRHEERAVARAILAEVRSLLAGRRWHETAVQLRRDADTMERLGVPGRPGVGPSRHFRLDVYEAFLPKLPLLPIPIVELAMSYYGTVATVQEDLGGLHDEIGFEALADKVGLSEEKRASLLAKASRRVADLVDRMLEQAEAVRDALAERYD